MKIKELNIHNFKNIKFSINNFGNYSLFFIFALLIPFQEWPDVNQHYQLKNMAVKIVRSGSVGINSN